MDQLKSKIVNVVLTIQQGRCMDIAKNRIFLSANFNGRVLESDPVQAEEVPIFNTNLIWEVEKKDLRKARSAAQPIKVDCMSIDNQNHREKLGYALLDLRSAQVVEDPSAVPFKWHKLLGVRTKQRSNCIAELYISLSLRDQEEPQQDQVVSEVWEPNPRKDTSVPIKYLEDGYIMIGDCETDLSDFSLNILIKSATNLDLLLPEVLVFNQNRNKYTMCITIFGIPIKTKQFTNELQERIIFDEKIVIRLLSTAEILKRFFDEETIEIGFNSGNDLLGTTTVKFEGLSNANEKLCLGACYFHFPSENGIVPIGKDGRKPSISLEIYLIKNEKVKEDEVLVDTSLACGDFVCEKTESKEDQLSLITEEQIRELEDWKERTKADFEQNLQAIKDKEYREIEAKKADLDENLEKCRKMQTEMQEKLDEINLSKTLKKRLKSSTSLSEMLNENQKKFAECDKDLLIEYISKLQTDNENLKQMINEQKQELESVQKTALTKEQTANLLQELKGLEEKFEQAQQSKSYFKDQWKRACQEIHQLKTDDYKQLQEELRERREELSELSLVGEYED